MQVYCGIDIVHIPRFKDTVDKHGPVNMDNPFIKRIYNKEELIHILSKQVPYSSLAGRFAAKEAVIKALCSIKRITVLKDVSIIGELPTVLLDKTLNLTDLKFSISISHDGEYAIAMATVMV